MNNIKKVSQSRLTSIDAMRVASLLAIILFHFNVEMIIKFGYQNVISWNGNRYIDLGQIGVGIFVIISGYSLMTSSRDASIIDFYKKRMLRILPPFYISYIVCLLVLIIFNGGVNFNTSPHRFLLTLIGFDGYFNYRLQSFYITGEWFLGAIISLYIIFPLACAIVKKSGNIAILITISLYEINHHFYSHIYKINEWNNIITMLVFFAFGMALKEIKNTSLASLFYFLLCMLYIVFFRDIDIVFTKITICIMLFIFVMTLFKIPVIAMIQSKKISYVANLGFYIFLVHHVLISIVVSKLSKEGKPVNSYLQFFIALSLSCAIGFICFKIHSRLSKK